MGEHHDALKPGEGGHHQLQRYSVLPEQRLIERCGEGGAFVHLELLQVDDSIHFAGSHDAGHPGAILRGDLHVSMSAAKDDNVQAGGFTICSQTQAMPETETRQAFTRMFGNGAIYALNPVPEDVARMAAVQINAQPVKSWNLDEGMLKTAARNLMRQDPDSSHLIFCLAPAISTMKQTKRTTVHESGLTTEIRGWPEHVDGRLVDRSRVQGQW